MTSIDFEKQAKIHLLKSMQSEMFKQEIEYFKNPSKKSPPGLHKDWDLFLDTSGLLRYQLRLDNAPHLSYEVKNPIVLDKSHLLTELIVREMHSKVLHLGIHATLNRIRMAGFRIPRPRQTA